MKKISKNMQEILDGEKEHKAQRIKDGNLFTGYDKVSPKSKMDLLLKMARHAESWDEKLVLEDLMRGVERSKLGLTLNYQYVDEKLNKSDAVFVEEKGLGLKVKDNQPNNLIIEGDNLHTLTALKNTNQEVDVIYIDPPYNTGREFAYNDKLVSNEDQQKHSKWLSFMSQRLELAKDIMSDDGVIFVSIDDNEQAYLKILLDETFGEQNSLANLIVQKKSGGGQAKHYYKGHDHLLIYSKNKQKVKGLFVDNPNQNNIIKEIDGEKYVCSLDSLRKMHGKFMKEKVAKGAIVHRNLFLEDYELQCSKEKSLKVKKDIKDKKIIPIWLKSQKAHVLTKATPIDSFESKKLLYSIITSWTSEGQDTFDSLFPERGRGDDGWFEAPKPVSLLKFILKYNFKDGIILDFFAGSGTTGQAVMELNQEDGGNRRFILCTNNERTGFDTIKNPEKGIARAICRERIYRVINGVGSKGEKIDWRYSNDIKSLKNNSVRYLKTELVNKRRYEKDKPHLTHNLFFTQEQIDLYKKEFDSDSTEAVTDFKRRKKSISR